MGLATKQKTSSCSSCESKKHSPFIQKQIKPSLQPKLKVGHPNDKYEREADVMAERVMRKPMESEGSVMEKTDQEGVQLKCASCEEQIQPKLNVGHPNDKYEREADVMAERVMRKPKENEGSVMEKTEQEGVQLKCSACEEGIQKKSSTTTSANHPPSALESQITASRGGGSPLSSSVNRSMSRSFSHDFSNVRIHTGSRARDMNDQLNAKAFTYGSDVYFNKGEYNPTSSSGKELLAHELTHVVQQSDGSSFPNSTSKKTNSIQAKYQRFFKKVPAAGGPIHEEVLTEFRKKNKTLATEVNIPGAKKDAQGHTEMGEADFYKGYPPRVLPGLKGSASPHTGTVERNSKYFENLKKRADTDFKWKVKKTTFSPRIDKNKIIGRFPDIYIGDLKPAETGEISKGRKQLTNYGEGYLKFAQAAIKSPKRPKVNLLKAGGSGINRVKIPNNLDYSKYNRENKNKGLISRLNPNYRLWVYYTGNKDHEGLFFYLDLPKKMDHRKKLTKNKINELDDYLRKLSRDMSGRKKIRRKSIEKSQTNNVKDGSKKLIRPGKKAIQKKEENPENWKKRKTLWVNNSRGYVKEYGGLVRKANFDDILSVKNGLTLKNIPRRKLEKIQFWASPLGEKFLGFRIKMEGFLSKIADKFEGLNKRFKSFKKKFQKIKTRWSLGWVSEVLNVLIKAAKIGIKQLAKKIWETLVNCTNAVIAQVIDSFMKGFNFDEMKEDVFKPFEDVFNKFKSFYNEILLFIKEAKSQLSKFIEIFETGQNIIGWIKKLEWTIRGIFQAISCGFPPFWGCLWGLVGQAVLGKIIGIVLESKKFQKKINDYAKKIIKEHFSDWLLNKLKEVFTKTGLGKYVANTGPACNVPPHKLNPNLPNTGLPENQYHILRKKWKNSREGKKARKKYLKDFGTDVCKNPIRLRDLAKVLNYLNKLKLKKKELEEILSKSRDPKTKKIDVQKLIDQFKGKINDAEVDQLTEAELKKNFCARPDEKNLKQMLRKAKNQYAKKSTTSSAENEETESSLQKPNGGENSEVDESRDNKETQESGKSSGKSSKKKKPFVIAIGNPRAKVSGWALIYDYYFDQSKAIGIELYAGESRRSRPDWRPKIYVQSILYSDNPHAFLTATMNGDKVELYNDETNSREATANHFKGNVYEIISGPLFKRVKATIRREKRKGKIESNIGNRIFFRVFSTGGIPPLQHSQIQRKRKASEEGIQKQSSVTMPAEQASFGLESQISASGGGDSPLSASINRSMSRSFGHDFSNVRIHTNSSAHAMNDQLNARAFTYGSDIYFNKGEYNPTSSSGRELLAHELTHVRQQGSIRERIQRSPGGAVKSLKPLQQVADGIARLAVGPSSAKVNLKGAPGPVISVIRNMRTGEIYVGLNTGSPENLTKHISTEIAALKRRIAAGELRVVHTAVDAQGGHAEVNALNKAIAAEQRALGVAAMTADEIAVTFEMHNVWLGGNRKFTAAARCEHCSSISRGVKVTQSMFIAEGGVVGEIEVSTRAHIVKTGGIRVEAETVKGETSTKVPKSDLKVNAPVVRSTAKLAVTKIGLNVLFFVVVHYANKWHDERVARKFNSDLKKLLPGINALLKTKEDEIIEKSKGFPLVYGNVTIVYAHEAGSKDYEESSMRLQDIAISHQNYQTPKSTKWVQGGTRRWRQFYLTFSVPLFEEKMAEKGASSLVSVYRRARERLISPDLKQRLSTVLTLTKLAKQDSSLETLVVRDLLGMLKDEDALVRLVAADSLYRLKAKIAIQYLRDLIPITGKDSQKKLMQRFLHELEQG